MDLRVKWGVIGAGGIAQRRTIPEVVQFSGKAEITAVMDIDAERARAVAEKFSVPFYSTSEEELLEQDIDAVYIATPNNMHCRQTVQAAKAGKHVLCEKPMALTIAEVDEMQEAVSSAGVKFMLGFCMRNNVYNRKARELVQSGALGRMVMGRAQLTCWYPPIPGAWRQDISLSGGGSLIDLGTHCLDLLEWIMGAKVVEVVGFQDLMVHAYPTNIEDASTILVRLSNGAHGVIDNYFNVPDAAAENTLELYGTRGSVIGHGTIGQDPSGRMFSILQSQETGYDAGQLRDKETNRQEYHLQGVGLYWQMVDQFSDCILRDLDPPVTLEDGRHSVRLVEAIYRAVREKRVVEVQD